MYPYRKFIKSLRWAQGATPRGVSREQRDLLQVSKLIQQKIYGEGDPSDVQVTTVPDVGAGYTIRLRTGGKETKGVRYFQGLFKFLEEFPKEKAKLPYCLEVEYPEQPLLQDNRGSQPAPQGLVATTDCMEPPILDPVTP